MMIYKCVQDGFILGIGKTEFLESNESEITEEEYMRILSVIEKKPYIDTNTKKYYLTETFEWVEVEEPPIPEPELSDSEALSIILGDEE